MSKKLSLQKYLQTVNELKAVKEEYNELHKVLEKTIPLFTFNFMCADCLESSRLVDKLRTVALGKEGS